MTRAEKIALDRIPQTADACLYDPAKLRATFAAALEDFGRERCGRLQAELRVRTYKPVVISLGPAQIDSPNFQHSCLRICASLAVIRPQGHLGASERGRPPAQILRRAFCRLAASERILSGLSGWPQWGHLGFIRCPCPRVVRIVRRLP